MTTLTTGLKLERRLKMWGKRKENGVWIASRSRWKWMWKDHDALYIAIWKLRLRIMK